MNERQSNPQNEKIADPPYFLIQGKFVVPGTSSENYIENILKRAYASQ